MEDYVDGSLSCTALEYEKRERKDLQGFFDSSISNIRHPEVQEWGKDLLQERERLTSGDTRTTAEKFYDKSGY